MSGLLWVLILTTLGFALGKTVFRKYEDQLMFCLMMLPLVLLVVGLVGSLIVLWRKKRASGQNSGERGVTAKRPRWQYVLMIALALLALATLLVPCMVRTESELRIRASQQGLSLPDGFTSTSAWMSAASASKALRRKAMAWSSVWIRRSSNCWRAKRCKPSYRPVTTSR